MTRLVITLVVALCLGACEDAEEWDCTCTPTCDGTTSASFALDNVCGPPDANEAVGEAAEGCAEGLLEAGCFEATCACECVGQGAC